MHLLKTVAIEQANKQSAIQQFEEILAYFFILQGRNLLFYFFAANPAFTDKPLSLSEFSQKSLGHPEPPPRLIHKLGIFEQLSLINSSKNIIFLIFSNKNCRLARLHQGCFLFSSQEIAAVTCSLLFQCLFACQCAASLPNHSLPPFVSFHFHSFFISFHICIFSAINCEFLLI